MLSDIVLAQSDVKSFERVLISSEGQKGHVIPID